MKSVWKSAAMALMLLALVLGVRAAGGILRQGRPELLEAGAQAAPVEDWAAPDVEDMALYGLEPFDTTLPVVYIDTEGQRITKENKIWASLAVLDADPDGGSRSVMDTPDWSGSITIKYRGASSYSGFDKHQFRIKFYERQGSGKAQDVSFLGMGLNSEWVLNGPFLDKTLMRNRLVYSLGREMMEWAPDTRYVEVFLDGRYLGVYVAIEPVTNGTSRLRLAEFGLLSGETAYILKRDRVGTEGEPLNVYGKYAGRTYNDLTVEYPTPKKLTAEQTAWITEDVSRFEQALFGDDFADPAIGYARYIDVDDFVDYFILNETVMNHDAGNLSTYPYKELGGKLKLAIWDYNNCYDNYQWFAEDFSEIFTLADGWYARLLQDRAFVDRVVERYEMWRESTLSTEHMLSMLDDFQAELGDARERNFAVWGYTFAINMMGDASRDIKSYEAAVAQLKDAIERRFAYLDEHIEDLYQYCVN